jgi:hypothetical protein
MTTGHFLPHFLPHYWIVFAALLLSDIQTGENILWHIICFVNSLNDINPGAMKRL